MAKSETAGEWGRSGTWRCLVTLGMAAGVALGVIGKATAAAGTAADAPACGVNCAAQAGPGGQIKWHPGYYIGLPLSADKSSGDTLLQSVLALLGSDSNIAGVQVNLRWADLEGDRPGDYAAGFARVDSLLEQLSKLPAARRLMISVADRSFGDPTGKPQGVLPHYVLEMTAGVVAAPAGDRWAGSLVEIAQLDNPEVTDRLIALAQAYGQRYDANPLVEMYAPMGETAVSSQAGFDSDDYSAQVRRLYEATSRAWPRTLVRWQMNYAPGDNNDRKLLRWLAVCRKLQNCAVGGPGPEWPLPLSAKYPRGTRVIPANQVFRGLQSGYPSPSRYTDLRGIVPWVGEYQGALGTQRERIRSADFARYEIDVMHASHVVFVCNVTARAAAPGVGIPGGTPGWKDLQAYIDATQGRTVATLTGRD